MPTTHLPVLSRSILASLSTVLLIALPATAFSEIISSGPINLERLFLDAFTPGTGNGISINSSGTAFGASSDSAFTDVDIDGDSVNDVRVNMSYSLHRNGDARIGFRANSANTALTLFSDSNTGTDYDYGFLGLNWTLQTLAGGGPNPGNPFMIDSIPDLTTSSLNGSTEYYEFGIIDTQGTLTAANIASYDASRYTGLAGDLDFSGAVNSLGDANEILLPEHLAGIPGLTFDAEATVIGDLSNSANPGGNQASDNHTISGNGVTSLTLWYGGFDVGESTNIGSPTASFNFSGTLQMTSPTAVPEPSTFGFLIILGSITAWRRSKRQPAQSSGKA